MKMKLMQRRRDWRHKSVLSLIRSEGGGDPIEIIRSKARQIVDWAKDNGWSGPPFNPRLLASMRGIRTRESKALFSAEAQLTPMEGDQLLLEFNPNRCSGRKNYSISHELVHTLFDDCFEMVHQRKANRKAFDPEEEVELLCQIGAAEFLMPEEDFRADLETMEFSLRSISPLMKRYDASREAIARRMLSLGERTAALVFLSKRLKPIEIKMAKSHKLPAPEPKMRVLYSVCTGEFPAFLPEHKSAPNDSCVNATDSLDDVVQGFETWDIAGLGSCFVEAIGLPIIDPSDLSTPSVMALIQPNRRLFR